MYEMRQSNQMKRDVKLMKRQHRDMAKLDKVLDLLAEGNPLPPEYKDHQLKGNYKAFRECHIEPDWLLIYKIVESELIIIAIATGSHSVALEKLLS
jgi:mRNA interferase YafQ